jgi:hypothetical protein
MKITHLLLAAALCAGAAVRADGDAADAPRTLRFARGHSSVTVQGAVVRGDHDRWRFGARAGQQATLKITALEKNAVFQVWRPGAKLPATADGRIEGQPLDGAADIDEATDWSGVLPDSGDYVVEVSGTRGNASYRLTLKIAP